MNKTRIIALAAVLIVSAVIVYFGMSSQWWTKLKPYTIAVRTPSGVFLEDVRRLGFYESENADKWLLEGLPAFEGIEGLFSRARPVPSFNQENVTLHAPINGKDYFWGLYVRSKIYTEFALFALSKDGEYYFAGVDVAKDEFAAFERVSEIIAKSQNQSGDDNSE
tara:strand:+ start:1718 stop:2212 length:495 start_codon:yes stop_codon:yes gene_type:complete